MTSLSVCPLHKKTRGGTFISSFLNFSFKMIALFHRILDWFKSLFWKEEMELTLVGLQYSGKTTFVNVIAVSMPTPSSVAVDAVTALTHSISHCLKGWLSFPSSCYIFLYLFWLPSFYLNCIKGVIHAIIYTVQSSCRSVTIVRPMECPAMTITASVVLLGSYLGY